MLELLRGTGQSIMISLPGGVVVEVKVFGIQGGRVRVGVQAPKHIAVDRAEEREARTAAAAGGVLACPATVLPNEG